MLSHLAAAQHYPRDTSYSIQLAYKKIKKKHPAVTPIKPLLPDGVIAKADIVYAKHGRDLHLDIFYPAERGKYPGVLLIYGGGWSSGTKDNQVPMAQQIAAQGFVTVAVEYRLSPEIGFPAAVYDLKAAIRWMRAHAERYSLDPQKIAALGCSAGAQLATLLGTTNGKPEFEGDKTAYDISSDVQAIVNIDGIVSFVHPESEEGEYAAKWLGGDQEEVPERWKAASPLEYVDHKTPPTLFVNSSFPRFHAGRDDMIQLLDNFGTYSEIHTLPDSPHSFWLVNPWFKPTLALTIKFLNKVFNKA